jgi:hypothetical protein
MSEKSFELVNRLVRLGDPPWLSQLRRFERMMDPLKPFRHFVPEALPPDPFEGYRNLIRTTKTLEAAFEPNRRIQRLFDVADELHLKTEQLVAVLSFRAFRFELPIFPALLILPLKELVRLNDESNALWNDPIGQERHLEHFCLYVLDEQGERLEADLIEALDALVPLGLPDYRPAVRELFLLYREGRQTLPYACYAIADGWFGWAALHSKHPKVTDKNANQLLYSKSFRERRDAVILKSSPVGTPRRRMEASLHRSVRTLATVLGREHWLLRDGPAPDNQPSRHAFQHGAAPTGTDAERIRSLLWLCLMGLWVQSVCG